VRASTPIYRQIQVANRLIRTASPARGGDHQSVYGVVGPGSRHLGLPEGPAKAAEGSFRLHYTARADRARNMVP